MDTKYQFAQKYPINKVSGDIGIEIEMEGVGLGLVTQALDAAGNKKWAMKEDGSLRGESCEWVLNKPLSPIAAMSALDDLYSAAAIRRKFQPSRRCGVHIHVNVQKMTSKQIFNFICLYMLFENVLIRWASREREGNFFCLRATDARYLSAQLSKAWNKGDLSEAADDYLRYAALNVGALWKFGSLEFRALPTPVKPFRIKSWIRLLLALREASNNYAHPKEIVQEYGAIGPKEMIQKVFGAGCPLGTVADLRGLTKQGMRNVQDIIILRPMKHHSGPSAITGHWYGPSNMDFSPEPSGFSDFLYEEESYDSEF